MHVTLTTNENRSGGRYQGKPSRKNKRFLVMQPYLSNIDPGIINLLNNFN